MKLKKLLEQFDAQLRRTSAVSRTILQAIPLGLDELRRELSRIVEILKDPDGETNKYEVAHIGAHAEKAIGLVLNFELKYLNSKYVSDIWRARVEALTSEHKLTIDARRRFVSWERKRGKGAAHLTLRALYFNMVHAVRHAEKFEAKQRVKATLTLMPTKPAIERRSSENPTNIGAGTQKGPVGQTADTKKGGWGTSRKSEQKRRSRMRRMANAS